MPAKRNEQIIETMFPNWLPSFTIYRELTFLVMLLHSQLRNSTIRPNRTSSPLVQFKQVNSLHTRCDSYCIFHAYESETSNEVA
jgi:hypothetical protein